jgi:hypothetical protein
MKIQTISGEPPLPPQFQLDKVKATCSEAKQAHDKECPAKTYSVYEFLKYSNHDSRKCTADNI